jgi:hypothetical protein
LLIAIDVTLLFMHTNMIFGHLYFSQPRKSVYGNQHIIYGNPTDGGMTAQLNVLDGGAACGLKLYPNYG